jgi:hypothetical protein
MILEKKTPTATAPTRPHKALRLRARLVSTPQKAGGVVDDA